MPPKRNKKWNNEQNKTITSRLMVIRLKADEYIYNRKPISISEAQLYEQELETLRQGCKDIRCLQVIETLTSYMRCIITEQLPICETENIEMVTVKNFKEGTQHDTRAQAQVAQAGIEPSTPKPIILSNIVIKPNADVDISVNYLPVAMREKPFTETQSNFNELSYSKIHTNMQVEALNIKKQNVKEIVYGKDSLQTVVNNTKRGNNKRKINLNKTKLDSNKVQQNPVKMNNKNTEKDLKRSSVRTSDRNEKNNRKQKKTVALRSIKKPVSNINITNNKIKRKCSARKKRNKVLNAEKETLMPYDQAIGNLVNSAKKLTLKATKNKRSSKKKEIDLKWVGNLSFMREIDKDEYIKFDNNLDESFWNDTSLPPNINITDFEYSDIEIR